MTLIMLQLPEQAVGWVSRKEIYAMDSALGMHWAVFNKTDQVFDNVHILKLKFIAIS